MTVLLADDHVVMREALRGLLEQREGIRVVGEASDGVRAVELVQRLAPDVVIMDIWMPRLSGIEATRRIVRGRRGPKVIILSMHEGRAYVEQALQAGASGYLVKKSASKELFDAIDAVSQGQSYISPAVAEQVLQSFGSLHTSPLASLTAREREILRLIAEGLSSKEIAAELDVSTRTADAHRANLMRKLDLHKTASLVRLAIREGLLEP